MIKIVLPILFIFGLLSCAQSTESVSYFGQAYPDSIPVIFAPDIVSVKGRSEHGISFAPDALELAFGILNKDGTGNVLYSKKVNEKWTEPTFFKPLKEKNVFLPYFSPDGKSLLYAQGKSESNVYSTDIFILEKTNGIWGTPERLHAPISSISREANACMTNDRTIYFSSNRNCEGKENCYDADLFYSKSHNNTYEGAEVIPEFSSSNDEESVFIDPKENYIMFCRYTDTKTGMDLYISYRDVNGNWSEPQLLDATINSKDWDRRPFVSIDNNFLFFTRLQVSENEIKESDIFWVNTSKVFKPFIYNSLSDMVLQVGEKFELSIPEDYFKDIDDTQLRLSINQTELDWLEFNSTNRRLSGLPTHEGNFELTFTAVDKFSNSTEDQIKLTVLK